LKKNIAQRTQYKYTETAVVLKQIDMTTENCQQQKSRLRSPSRVRGGTPAEIESGAFLP